MPYSIFLRGGMGCGLLVAAVGVGSVPPTLLVPGRPVAIRTAAPQRFRV